MERNNKLPKIKPFNNEEHFYRYTIQLLTFLYPSANISIKGKKIILKNILNNEVVLEITATSLYPNLSSSFREENPRFSKNGSIFLEEINSNFQWTGSSGLGYMYPRDRDNFEDTKFGMEQKAYYFISVIQVVLQFLKQEKI